MVVELSLEDQELAEAFDRRMQIVRDRTRGAVAGWHTGFYLWGEGGIPKSSTVVEELEKLRTLVQNHEHPFDWKGTP